MRILVVDDDEVLVEVLQNSLMEQRHVVEVAEDGSMGWEYVQADEYDLVLLDVNLPELDGISLCQKMRSEGYGTPILLMTAKNASQDRILGLDAGADDYLTKPLDLGELNARVRALSRRGNVATSTVLNVNGLILDPSSCQVSYQQTPIKLTAKEYSLLELFLRNPTRVFSRSQILDKIWTFDDSPLEESVKAHIKGLRKKLKQAGLVNWIENVYGIGYRLNPQTINNTNHHSSSVQQEFEQKMEQMWLKYQAKMLERMSVLKNFVLALKKRQLSPYLQYEAEKAAHKLAGVLGMFSRQTGTDIACEIENLLQEHKVLELEQQERLIALVKDLDSLLALDENLSGDSTGKTNLLLISADAHLYHSLQQLSSTQGMAWYQAENVLQAKDWLQRNTAYLVLIDSEKNTDRESYLSLLEELNTYSPTIPTLVLSNAEDLNLRLAIAQAGANSLLVQPLTPEQIWQTTKQLIEQQRSSIASILIVDDDLIFLEAMVSLLEPWGINVHTLNQPTNFWKTLSATKPDLVILDVAMPDINGLELCQALRNDPDWQELPVLFLTARQDAQTIQQVFEIGGDDYICKPVVGAELIARINNRLERSRLLHSLATQDRLTGLSNRSHSSRAIETFLSQIPNNNQVFSLAVLKITELSQINWQYGHIIGDRILAQWGKVIQAALRHDEITGYWGNGDFIIGMPHRDKTQGQEKLTELLTILRKQIFTSLEGDRFQVSFNYAVVDLGEKRKTLQSLYQACVNSFDSNL